MIIIPRRKKHIYIRPSIRYKKPLHYSSPLENIEKLLTTGKWIPDDGKPGLAFVGLSYGIPFAWYGKCKCDIWIKNCPKELTMDHCFKQYSCSNGIEMNKFKKVKE